MKTKCLFLSRAVLIALIFIFSFPMVKAASITSNASGLWSSTAWPSTLRTGTISVTTVSKVITGSGTAFLSEISPGNIIYTTGGTSIGIVTSVTDDTHLYLMFRPSSALTAISFKSQGVGAVDDVTIASGASITIDGQYTVASLTFAAASANTTVTMGISNPISTCNASALTVTGNMSMAVPTGTHNCTFAVGRGTLTLGSLTMNATTSGNNNIITISTGVLTVTGAITTGTTGCQITFSNAGLFNIGGSVTGTPSFTKVTGCTVNYNGGAQTVNSFGYDNLTLSSSGTKTFAALTAISGALTINDGVVAALGTFSHTANRLALGSVSQNAGTWGGTGSGATNINTTYFAANTGKVTAAAGTCTQWTGGTNTAWSTTTNWIGGAVPTTTSDVFIPNVTNKPVIGAAAMCHDLTIGDGATLTVSGSNTLGVSGNWTNNGTLTPGTGTVTFSGIQKTISGSATTTFYNVVVTSTADYTMNSNISCNKFTLEASGLTLAGDFHAFTFGTSNPVMSAGTVVLDATGTLYPGPILSKLAVGGGRLTTNLIQITGADQGAPPVVTANDISMLEVSKGGVINCNGNLEFYPTNADQKQKEDAMLRVDDGGTFNITGDFGMYFTGRGGNLQSGPGSTIHFKGSGLQMMGSYGFNGIFRVNNTHGVTWGGGNIFDLLIGDSLAGSVYYDGGDLTTINGDNFEVIQLDLVSGTYFVNRTKSNQSGPFPWLVTNISQGTTVNYNVVNLAQSVVADNYANLIISGNRFANNATLPSSGTIGVSGDYTLTATFSTGNLITTGSTFDFNGTGAQSINNAGKPFNNVTISNPTGICTALNAINTASGSFSSVAGSTLDMGTNLLTVGTLSHLGTLKTQNLTSAPITTGKTWGGTVIYNAATGGQTIVAGTYYNLMMGNTSGLQTVAGNINVQHALDVGAGGNFTNPSGKVVTVGL
ncbi:MAG: hypothetical protein NTU98_13615 [Bacteroidetes bacterium]|nr:hypothetical protein [Bacteroidota bacterium]